jgi:hypothetical protein
MVAVLTRALVVIGCAAALTYGKACKKVIELDYRTAAEVTYEMRYQAQCVMQRSDSTTQEDMKIMGTLRGMVTAGATRINFKLQDVKMKTLFYGDSAQKRIIDDLQAATYSLALINGCPVVDTLSSFAADGLREWDLLLQFSRLRPDVPLQPVKKGYAWERTGVYKLPTVHGNVMPCQTYRLYKIDRFSACGDTVFIGWKFRYDAEESALNPNQARRHVPVSGNGDGTAVLDLRHKRIVSAVINFKTPLSKSEDGSVFWNERTVLRAVDFK